MSLKFKGLSRRIVGVSVLACATACAPALPEQDPEGVLGNYVRLAHEAADRAASHRAQAKVERERGARLVEEANSLVERSEAATAKCADLVKRIPKPKKVVRPVEPPPAEAAPSTSTPTVTPPPGTTTSQPKVDDPPWSPSDGPF